jgi:glycosyltransferase involved in cell wall biosynthesis
VKIALIAPSEIPARRANTFQVMKMAQALISLGHEVHLAAPVLDSSKAGLYDQEHPEWEQLENHYGLRQRFPLRRIVAAERMHRYDYGIQAVRWARDWGAELLYSRLPQAAAAGSLLGTPTLLETHDYPQGRVGPWLFKMFLTGRGRRRLVVITRGLADDLVKLGAPTSLPFTVIAPDGVDLARYANLPDLRTARSLLRSRYNLAVEIDGFLAGYTGHFYRGRGIHHMLAMASLLPEVTFLLVGGESSEVELLRQKIAQLGLQNVILTGFVFNAELPVFQSACDLLLMPYQNEVSGSSGGEIARYLSPMKLFEYMACDRAILSSNLPVIQEVLDQHNSVLLPPGDLDAWVGAVRRLCSNPEQRAELGERARQDVSRYTWEGRAEKVLEGL